MIPKVAVGLFVYNGERFLPEAIKSILAQTYRDFELIISDNASTDATEELCRDAAGRDPRVRYVRQAKNEGAAANCNRVFALARSPYFKWAADDDILGPRFLERCVAVLDADPSVVVSFTETRLIDAAGVDLPWDPVREAFIDDDGLPMFRRHLTTPAVTQALGSVDPVRRFEAVHADVRLCAEIFGVLRSSALARTGLHGPYYGSDRTLLAELGLLGRIVSHDRPHDREDLFFRRCHRGQSTSMTPREAAEFTTAKPAGRVVVPARLNMLIGFWRAVCQGPLTWGQRASCLASLARHTVNGENLSRLVVPTPRNYLVTFVRRYLGARGCPSRRPGRDAASETAPGVDRSPPGRRTDGRPPWPAD